ncbi:hypothetical protein B0T16DRAFT_410608 [Cercophora newfieldiana]|uniref:Uncharacterized protein n=1 Tax=Cercophora newfieldiana TaxID=92897 RepID=A0AA40CSK5_9PEZI|nr:hypothetical protein B0T16DRAFT_410608 [Cercophora newfieldiana]
MVFRIYIEALLLLKTSSLPTIKHHTHTFALPSYTPHYPKLLNHHSTPSHQFFPTYRPAPPHLARCSYLSSLSPWRRFSVFPAPIPFPRWHRAPPASSSATIATAVLDASTAVITACHGRAHYQQRRGQPHDPPYPSRRCVASR